jgi:uroporphyrinogen decarboxylase
MKLLTYFKKFDRVPVVPILGYPALIPLNQTSSISLLKPEKHAKVVEYIAEEYGTDALLPLLDLTVEAEALGVEVGFREIDAPKINKTIDIGEVHKRKSDGRIPVMAKTVRTIKKISGNLPVGFYVTGPFTVAGQVIGITNLLKFILTNPEALPPLLDTVVETSIEYAKKLEDSGADFIVIAEPSSSLISVSQFREFSKPYLRRLTKAVDAGMVLHICGRSRHLLTDMAETGAAGISIDQNIPMLEAVSIVPENILVFGNYSPVNLMMEDPETIRTNVLKMLSPVKDKKNVVSSTGCDIPSKTPSENIRAFVETSKSIRRI